MKILYVRCSTLDQDTDRQRVNQNDFGLVIEDRCSGTVPFFEREGGSKIRSLVESGSVTSISCWEIDRGGRDLWDILNTIHWLTEHKISVHFIKQNLRTMDLEGQIDPIAQATIAILGVVSQMEGRFIKERQMEGIKLAKLKKGLYLGRKAGSKGACRDLLSKGEK